MKKIKLEIVKFNNLYRLCKTIETDTGMNLIILFTGSKADCERMKREYEKK